MTIKLLNGMKNWLCFQTWGSACGSCSDCSRTDSAATLLETTAEHMDTSTHFMLLAITLYVSFSLWVKEGSQKVRKEWKNVNQQYHSQKVRKEWKNVNQQYHSQKVRKEWKNANQQCHSQKVRKEWKNANQQCHSQKVRKEWKNANQQCQISQIADLGAF